LVSIPMREGVESLNVATATALMLFEVNSPT
jgi:tRNA G18 (ribose-2'-O)-methylase SpoU